MKILIVCGNSFYVSPVADRLTQVSIFAKKLGGHLFAISSAKVNNLLFDNNLTDDWMGGECFRGMKLN